MEIHYLLLVFFGVFSNTQIGSTVKPTAELSLEETVRQLSSKMAEMENEKLESRKWRNDLSVKLQELQQRTLEQRDDEVLKRVTEVEMRSEQSMTSLAEKLQNAEARLKKVDNHLLMELLQLKPMLKETVEKVRSVEEQVTSAMERERKKTHSLQVQMTELNSEIHSVDIIRKNMSSMVVNLRLELNGSLSNLTRNMRIFETLQSEMSPRLEKLEEKSVSSVDVLEMKKTLTNHSSLLRRLNQLLWEYDNTCDGEPPSIRNGKPLRFDRRHKSTVQYECDQDFVVTGNSTVLCEYGKWEGHPPICSFFDTTFTLVRTFGFFPSITCYSDKYSQNIEFSWVVDTGSGLGLPTPSRQEGAVLSFPIFYKMTGAVECRFHVDDRSAGIVLPLQVHGASVFFTHRSKVAIIGKTVELRVSTRGNAQKSKLRWRHNGVLVPPWSGQQRVEISGVTPADAGIYECYQDGERTNQTALRLIVRKCEKDRYGENCEQECPVCYNGGVCHDILGVCICPAGFTGNNCEFACNRNHFSRDCANKCIRDNCKNELFCKPDPYGCSCFPGFEGILCDSKCDRGWYGADCKQACHCDGNCDRFTGVCSGGCSPGWRGSSCQIEVVN